MKLIKMKCCESYFEMKYYEGDQTEILSRWSKWNIMKAMKMKYHEGDQNEIFWRWSRNKYYEGDLQMKYYEGDQDEILWRWQ